MITVQPQTNAFTLTSAALIESGRALFYKGQRYQAQMAFAEAVILSPDNAEYKNVLIQSLAGQIFTRYNETVSNAISLCLTDNTLRHLPLFPSWHSLLLLKPGIGLLFTLQQAKDYNAFHKILKSQDNLDTLNDDFLNHGLRRLLLRDYNIERLMTHLRRFALLHASTDQLQRILPFMVSLSEQCFFNEYLFFVTTEEKQKLEFALTATDVADPVNIILLSCYLPLYQMTDTKTIGHTLESCAIPDADRIVQIQITEPLKEQTLAQNMGSFCEIKNKTSQSVQGQYEEHPFPRWNSCGSFRAQDKKELSAGKKILVAGCGTGQEAAIVSMNFPLADITAIDLSRTSLSYAQRKAEEYGLTNLTFLHGDILEVGAIGKSFDYIVSGGVLHHMQDPKEGFRSLRDVLAPDGVMRIALYSETARQSIVAVQDYIVAKKIPSTSEGIRTFRRDFFEGGYMDIFEDPLPYFEMFSLSETRDLFFHVQEHRFTCPGLKNLMTEMNMDILVFAPEAYAAHQRYKQLFPDDPSATNLENWDKIERNNPGLFIGMYKLYAGNSGQHEIGKIPKWLSA